MFYTTTFLSSECLKPEQEYMDANKNEDFHDWKLAQELYGKGKYSADELKSHLQKCARIRLESNRLRVLTQSEIAEEDEQLKKIAQIDPNRFERQIEENKKKPLNRLRRKGYK